MYLMCMGLFYSLEAFLMVIINDLLQCVSLCYGILVNFDLRYFRTFT